MDTMYFVNKRPVTRMSKHIKNLFESLRNCIFNNYNVEKDKKNSFMLLSIMTHQKVLDVNIEPNKESVTIHDESDVVEL